MKPSWLVSLLLILPGHVQAGVNRYQYRPKDLSGAPTAKTPQFLLADTEAELPSVNVYEGDIAYTKDTDRLWKRTDSAWAEIAAGGGGGGSANIVEAEVDFGATGNTNAAVVVTGQAWVTSTSKIVCAPTLLGTADRAEGAEDAIIEGITASFHTRVVGTGFTVAAAAQQGRAYGRYKIICTGA